MIEVSLIVVAYHDFDSLTKLLTSLPSLPWLEVLVINNTRHNRGFGAACNQAAMMAKGKYLLFVNPDCRLDETAIVQMKARLQANPTIGLLGPRLTDISGKPYLSCSRLPTKSTAMVVYSILNRWLHRTTLVQNHWYHFLPPRRFGEVGIVSGAVIMIPRTLFATLNGFDERFFLYWEEVDLAWRVAAVGKRVMFDPQTSVVHVGETSTQTVKVAAKRWFRESRWYLLKKHFGWAYAAIADAWFGFTEEWRLVAAWLGILGVAGWVFKQGWWWLPGNMWLMNVTHSILPSLRLSYWLNAAAALMLMVAVYSWQGLGRRQRGFWLALAAGVIQLSLGAGGWWLIIGGLIWITFDLIKSLERYRILVIGSWLGAALLLSVLAVRFTWMNQGKLLISSPWGKVSDVIQSQVNERVWLHCIGCTNQANLTLLQWQLQQRGIVVSPEAKRTVYIILPPFSSYSLSNTQSVLAGKIRVAWSIAKL